METPKDAGKTVYELIGIVLLLAAVVTPMYNSVTAQGQAQEKHETEFKDFAKAYYADLLDRSYKRGISDQKIAGLEMVSVKTAEALRDLDTDIQREMRDLDRIAEEKVNGMDRRLQGEIANQGRLLQGAIDANRSAQEKQAEFQIMNREYVSQLFERINAAQRQLNMQADPLQLKKP